METRDRVRCLFYCTTLTQKEIATRLGVTQAAVAWQVKRFATPAERKARNSATYSRAMEGRQDGPLNPAWRGGEPVNSQGYRFVQAPDWWTGYRHGGARTYVLEHQLRVCELLGMTQIPRGYCVHHKDRDRLNNNLDNLQLMTLSEHNRLHNAEGW